MRTEPETTEIDEDGPELINLTRRQAVQGLAAGAGAAAVGIGADHAGYSPFGSARANPALTSAGAIFSAVESVQDFLLRDTSGTTAEEATKDATKTDLQTDLYEAAIKRQSENDSRFLSTEDIAELSRDTAYEQGKIAAFGPLESGASEQEVVDAAHNAIDEYFETPKENLLNQFSESSKELENFTSEIKSQGFNLNDFFGEYNPSGNARTPDRVADISTQQRTVELTNKSITITVPYVDMVVLGSSSGDEYNSSGTWGPTSRTGDLQGSDEDSRIIVLDPSDNTETSYLKHSDWSSIWDQINTIRDEVKSGLSTWVNTVYGQLQAGEISIQDVASNLDLAQRALEDEGIPRAKADLLAMNLPVDLDREVTVSYTENSVEWTASGMFASLGSGSATWQSGTTYDASTQDTPRVIIATDGESVSGVWSDYNAALDGGVVEFTSQPLQAVYQITTNAGETATVESSAFSEDTDNDIWTADLSDQLNDPISEVESVMVLPQSTDDYQVVLDGQFTIERITNQETGEEVERAETDREKTPQRDDNYITSEEWEQLRKDREQQYEELKELFKEVEDEDDGNGGFTLFPGNPFGNLGAGLIGGIASLVFGGVFVFLAFLLIIVMIGAASG